MTRDKLLFTAKFNAIALIAFLSWHGAIKVSHQANWKPYGEAQAIELPKSHSMPQYIDSKAVAVPQDLEPIKIELTDSEKAGLAKCKKTKPVDYCDNLWGV